MCLFASNTPTLLKQVNLRHLKWPPIYEWGLGFIVCSVLIWYVALTLSEMSCNQGIKAPDIALSGPLYRVVLSVWKMYSFTQWLIFADFLTCFRYLKPTAQSRHFSLISSWLDIPVFDNCYNGQWECILDWWSPEQWSQDPEKSIALKLWSCITKACSNSTPDAVAQQRKHA